MHLSDSPPNSGSRNRARTLSAAMMMPETLSPMWKVSVRILGIRLSYICQKAQMDRNAKPTSTVRLVLSFIEEPPFPCRYNRIISVLLGEVQTFLSKESKKRVK